MSDVKRYGFYQVGGVATMHETSDGEYVLASDYDRKVAYLRRYCDSVDKQVAALKAERDGAVGIAGHLREKIAHLEAQLDGSSLLSPVRKLKAERDLLNVLRIASDSGDSKGLIAAHNAYDAWKRAQEVDNG